MEYHDYRIIIVDNASLDNSLSVLRSFVKAHRGNVIDCPPEDVSEKREALTLVLSKTNGGFATGNNLGIRHALTGDTGQYIWLLNNDTLVVKDTLSRLVTGYETRRSNGEPIGILGSKVLFDHDRQRIQAIGGEFLQKGAKVKLIGFNEVDRGQYDGNGERLDMVLGASMFVDRTFIEKVGGLNEDYFLYFEELDWSHRARESGYISSSETTSVIYHKQGRSTKNKVLGKKSEFAMYHSFTSLLKFYANYYPRQIYRAKLRIIIQLLKSGVKREVSPWRLLIRIFFKG